MRDKLHTLINIKFDIKSALQEKGLEVTDKFITYADKIRSLTNRPNMFAELGYTNEHEYWLNKLLDKSLLIIDSWNNTNTALVGLNVMFYPLIDTSNVTSSYNAFKNCDILTTIALLNTSNVINMSGMFYGCTNLLTVPKFDTSKVTDMSYMFYGCTNLEEIPDFNTLSVSDMSYMFSKCYSLKEMMLRDICISNASHFASDCSSLIKVDLTNTTLSGSLDNMFSDCTSLTELRINQDLSNVTSTTNMFKGVTTNGVFYCNKSYDYSKIIDVLPAGWTVAYFEETCTSLSITAEDVEWNETVTTITYIAEIVTSDGARRIEMGTATSEQFGTNESINSITRTISFTFMDVTAQTTITQGAFYFKYYEPILNYEWLPSTEIPNPDILRFDGVYESAMNQYVDDSTATMYIRIVGYDTFRIFVRSDGESLNDYLLVSELDQTIDNTTDFNEVKAHTKGNSQSGTDISNYTLVEFDNIGGGEHLITIMYRKDESGHSGNDRGYLLIPTNQ